MTTKVLHCFGGMDLAGAETFAMHVYRSVCADGLRFDFAVSSAKKCYYDDEIRSLGGTLLRHSPPADVGFRRFAQEFTGILQNHGPFSAVHSHLQYFSGYVLAVAAREQVPTRIAHFHNTQDARSGTLVGIAYHASMRWLIRRHATHILGCSAKVLTASLGPRWLRDPRVAVMCNGIALEPYSTVLHDRAELCRKFSIPCRGTVLGHIGRFSAAKNHQFLIELLQAYVRTDPNVVLVLVGDGELRSAIEHQVADRGLKHNVCFMGRRPQSDVPALLSVFDVLVMPSIHEGLPVTLVEAQAAGTSCVVSDEITSEADLGLGLLDFVSLKKHPQEWCARITAALDRQRPDWQARRQALRSSGYSIECSTEALVDIYRQSNGPCGLFQASTIVEPV